VDLNIMDADRVLNDTRISLRGYQDVTYRFDVPTGTRGPLKLVVDLNYWSFSQALLDSLIGKKAPRARVIRMVTAATTLQLERFAPASTGTGRQAPRVHSVAAVARLDH
jgi:hypothetical protein